MLNFRHTKKTIGLGYVSHFLQLLVEIKSMSEMDADIRELLMKNPHWESFRQKYILRQPKSEEAKAGNVLLSFFR